MSDNKKSNGKRTFKQNYKYYVLLGTDEPGIFDDYAECIDQRDKQNWGYCKGCQSKEEADQIIKDYLEKRKSQSKFDKKVQTKGQEVNKPGPNPSPTPIAKKSTNSSEQINKEEKNWSNKNGSLHGYYAVHRGKIRGIYKSWPECRDQIKGFENPEFKGLETKEEAEAFMWLGREDYRDIGEFKIFLITSSADKVAMFSDFNEAKKYAQDIDDAQIEPFESVMDACHTAHLFLLSCGLSKTTI
jgi:viroplasmin and RNaseH domain-containing protein